MISQVARGIRKVASAVAATTIVSFGLFAFDQGHIATIPRGIVEVGELVPVESTQMGRKEPPDDSRRRG